MHRSQKFYVAHPNCAESSQQEADKSGYYPERDTHCKILPECLKEAGKQCSSNGSRDQKVGVLIWKPVFSNISDRQRDSKSSNECYRNQR